LICSFNNELTDLTYIDDFVSIGLMLQNLLIWYFCPSRMA
jgi:hypothetical protein